MDLKPSPSVKSRTIPAACSPSTGRTSLATTMCEPSQQTDLLPMELPLMSSAAGSRARTLASLENGLALKVRALVSGESMPVSLASYDRASSSWKTSQACLISGWEPFSETWPRSGMMRHGTVFQLPPLAPLTGATEFGLLPTARATDGEKGSRTVEGAQREFARGKNLDLPMVAKLWPTPHANCSTGAKQSPNKQGGENLQTAAGGALNPTWVEWLQGFPLGWTEVE